MKDPEPCTAVLSMHDSCTCLVDGTEQSLALNPGCNAQDAEVRGVRTGGHSGLDGHRRAVGMEGYWDG